MNCEEASPIISARIDGESTGDAGAALDAHLAQCEACRLTLAEMELQDAALLRAFAPRQESAIAVADRVSQAISNDAPAARAIAARGLTPRLLRWTGWAAAAAAGFIAAIVLLKLGRPSPTPLSLSTTPRPPQRALLTLATGEVFVSGADHGPWRPYSPLESSDVGAAIRTTDTSKCELQLLDGSCMRLNSATEVHFNADRAVSVWRGQVWCAALPSAVPLRVSAGMTTVTACGADDGRRTEFDVACRANAAAVTVQRGSAEVVGNGSRTIVHQGEILDPALETGVYACKAAPDPLLATRWQDDLLLLKPGNDHDVVARVAQLMARVSAERAPSGTPGQTEQDVRADGAAWCSGITWYMRYHEKDVHHDTRRCAARLLADLAPPSSVPDLIDLLADDDSEIRHDAATALCRLTGQTLGHSPESCAASRDPAAIAAWRQWWEQNKSRHLAGK